MAYFSALQKLPATQILPPPCMYFMLSINAVKVGVFFPRELLTPASLHSIPFLGKKDHGRSVSSR